MIGNINWSEIWFSGKPKLCKISILNIRKIGRRKNVTSGIQLLLIFNPLYYAVRDNNKKKM